MNNTVLRKITMLQLVLVLCSICYGQEKTATDQGIIELGKKHRFYSKVLNEEREIWVRVPTGYNVDKASKYSVVYLLDGPNNFIYTAGLLRQLEIRSVPKSILVGIANTNRSRDLTPAIMEEGKVKSNSTMGGADNFMKMIENDLFPFIAQNYSINGFRTLVGHSYGGLFAIHSLATKPEMFNAYLAISPSLWWNDQKVVSYFEERLKANPDMKGLLYLIIANERGKMLGGLLKLVGVLESEAPKNLRWDYKVHPNEHHGSIPVVGTMEGFHFFYKDWHMTDLLKEQDKFGLRAFEWRAEKIKNEFDQELVLDYDMLSDFLYRLNEEKKFQEQLETALYLIQKGKKEVEFYEAVARSHIGLNNRAEAIRYYKEAYKLNPGYPPVVRMLDSLNVNKTTLYAPPAITKAELKKYIGKYSDGENTQSIAIVKDSLSITIKDHYINMFGKLAFMGDDTFYSTLDDFYFTVKFHFNEKNDKSPSFMTFRYVSGWTRKLGRSK